VTGHSVFLKPGSWSNAPPPPPPPYLSPDTCKDPPLCVPLQSEPPHHRPLVPRPQVHHQTPVNLFLLGPPPDPQSSSSRKLMVAWSEYNAPCSLTHSETLSLINIVLRQVLGFAREESRGVDISERAPSHTHALPRILSPFTTTPPPFLSPRPPPPPPPPRPSPFEIQLPAS
jgi:hypothetical protein